MTTSRRSFLGGAATVCGAGLLLPTLVSGCNRTEEPVVRVSDDDEPSQKSAEIERADAELLIKGAELEEGAVKVYTAAAGLPFIKSEAAVLQTAARFMGQHAEHRDALVRAARELGLGEVDPTRAPMPAIPKEILDAARPDAERRRAVLVFARSLEMAAAKAYYAYVVRKLRTDHARKVAADILPVETQHVAVYDLLLGGAVPAPTAFFSEQV